MLIVDIPVGIEAEDGEELYVDDIINYAAQAAVDLFEAERGTLGQGAGATMAKKIGSLWELNDWEEWFLKFKGTGFEEEAANLIEQKIGIQLERSLAEDPAADLYSERARIEHEMAMLNLERLKESTNKTIIVIQSSVSPPRAVSYYDSESEYIEEYLNKFIGDKRENQALKLVQEYLDIQKQINEANMGQDDFWDREQEIDNLMQDMSLQLLQQNVMEAQPTEGAEALPNMANDMVELMEGVSLDVPMGEMQARRGQIEVEELGEKTEGLDPAEVPEEERLVWNDGQHAKLKKEVIQNLMGGMKKKYPKGTKVTIDSLYDRQGDFYMVREQDTGRLFRVKWSDLEK
ncbi:MAG: hypothetical protein ACFFBS_10415 [Promethearchaeota archaeon]